MFRLRARLRDCVAIAGGKSTRNESEVLCRARWRNRHSGEHQRHRSDATMKEGKFTVLLVDAHTGIPFKEFFDKDGKAYVEAEPDREYFIRIHNGSVIRVKALIHVDGTSLGYNCNMRSNTSTDRGLWNVRGGVSNYTALKFSLQPVRTGTPRTKDQVALPYFGEVKVSFHEALEGEQVEVKDRDGTETFRSASATASGVISSSLTSSGDKKKAFKTDAGMHETGGTVTRMTTSYKRGIHLGEVTIQYCSVLGLIHKGILPSTPTCSQQHTPTGDTSTPKKKRGSSGIDASTIGGTRLDFEVGGDEGDSDFVEVVGSSSEPVQKKAKTSDKDVIIDLCESDAE